jgi:hypothetical protein
MYGSLRGSLALLSLASTNRTWACFGFPAPTFFLGCSIGTCGCPAQGVQHVLAVVHIAIAEFAPPFGQFNIGVYMARNS